MPKVSSKTPWNKAGVSKSTWYRNKKKRRAPGDATRAKIARAVRARRGPPGRGEIVGGPGVDVQAAIATAVEAALVTTAVSQLEYLLGQHHGGGPIVTMHGTFASWAACLRALRKAGY